MIKNVILTSLAIALFFASMFKIPETSTETTNIPLGEQKFKKLIYFVIDGLRFDGYFPTKKESIYFNNFKFTKNPEILKTTFFSVASIPTATTCRVVSLMTGSPSNLIEEFFTFFASRVLIESLPDKFADRTMKSYGDDLWPISFAILKNKSSSYCGFSKSNLKEKETKLTNEILKDKDIDIKFIHTTSVDACGHYENTIFHESLQEAHLRADDLLIRLYEQMDEDTLLVVTSDHGITDQGSHGGSSNTEMASFCGFYSKRKGFFKDETDFNVYNNDFIDKFYEIKKNSETDWIKEQYPYKIIHQDDILPTVCYLMGIPAPFNTYGNLIPYIVNDNKAQKILYDQKKKLIDMMKIDDSKIDTSDYFKANMIFTDLIFEKSMGKRPLFSMISIFIGLMLIYRLFNKVIKTESYKNHIFSNLSYLIAMIMVTHSYWSFASEDVVWSCVFLLNNLSFTNLIFILFFLKTPGRYAFEIDRVNTYISHFKSPFELLGLMTAFFILKNISFEIKNGCFLVTKLNNNFLKNCLKNFPQFCFSFYSLFKGIDSQSRILFLCAYPSIDSLLTVHLPAEVSIIFLYFLKNIKIKKSQGVKHILLSLCPYLTNLEKVQQSIRCDVFFALTKNFSFITSAIALISYFIIPRYLVMKRFEINLFGMLLNMFSLFFCFACSWVLKNSLVFQYFFSGRLLFVTMFYIIDVGLEALLMLMNHNNIVIKDDNDY